MRNRRAFSLFTHVVVAIISILATISISEFITSQREEGPKSPEIKIAALKVRHCLNNCNFQLEKGNVEEAIQSLLQAYDNLGVAEETKRAIEISLGWWIARKADDEFAVLRRELGDATRKLIQRKSTSQPATDLPERAADLSHEWLKNDIMPEGERREKQERIQYGRVHPSFCNRLYLGDDNHTKITIS